MTQRFWPLGARVMDLPTDAFTTAPARWIAAISLKPEKAFTLMMWFEVCVVMSALWMTISISALFSSPQSCAFEAAGDTPSQYCEHLIWADTILWTWSTGLTNLGCVSSWFLQHIIALDTCNCKDTLVQWLVRNVKIYKHT